MKSLCQEESAFLLIPSDGRVRMLINAAVVYAACPLGSGLFNEWKWFSAAGPAGEAAAAGPGGGAAPHGPSGAPFPGAAILVCSMAPAWAPGSRGGPGPLPAQGGRCLGAGGGARSALTAAIAALPQHRGSGAPQAGERVRESHGLRGPQPPGALHGVRGAALEGKGLGAGNCAWRKAPRRAEAAPAHAPFPSASFPGRFRAGEAAAEEQRGVGHFDVRGGTNFVSGAKN